LSAETGESPHEQPDEAAIRNPTTERIISSTVQVLRVSLPGMSKYFATIQDPPSLTWFAMIEPRKRG
jgi:hypothetical protein